MKVPVPTAGSAKVTVGAAKPLMQSEARRPQRLMHKRDHSLNDFRRRVIRAGLLPQLVVVHGEEVFVKVKPSVGIALADLAPVNLVEHARERRERGL